MKLEFTWISFEEENPPNNVVVLILGRDAKEPKSRKYHWGLGSMKDGKLNIISLTLVPSSGAEYDPLCWSKLPSASVCAIRAADRYVDLYNSFSVLLGDL